MTALNLCTYFDGNYLTRALVLYRSLVETKADFTLWALCLDDASLEAVTRLDLPGFVAVPLTDLEAHDPDLVTVKPSRSRVEYYFTVTPALPLYILAHQPGIESISYLDADLRFYASPELVLDHMGDGSVAIIPHGYPESLSHLAMYGIYNVGMVAFRNDDRGVAVLERWRSECLEWCYDRVENGKFADQAYLDDWPETLPGVVVVDEPGIGLGPWNAMRYSIDVSGPTILVDDRPLVFYHFHAFRAVASHLYYDGLLEYGGMPRRVRQRLYGDYIRELAMASKVASVGLPAARAVRGVTSLRPRQFIGLLRRGRILLEVGGRVIG